MQTSEAIETPTDDQKSYTRTWAMLIRKIYEVDPLRCPKCGGEMKVIALIHEPDTISGILEHLGLLDIEIEHGAPPDQTGQKIEYVPAESDWNLNETGTDYAA